MGVIVNFDYSAWAAAFPMFCNLTSDQVQTAVLPLAETYCRNDGSGPVNNSGLQTALLNLMVAHIAQLMFGVNGEPASPLVGRVSSAAEGSINVTVDMPEGVPQAAWYNQTQFGAMYWQMMSPYRTMRYIPGPRRRGFGFGSPWPGALGW